MSEYENMRAADIMVEALIDWKVIPFLVYQVMASMGLWKH